MTTSLRGDAWVRAIDWTGGGGTVAVVGAGITGLAAAFAAQRRGRRVTVFEATPHVGGVIATERLGGFLIETGPTSFSETPEIAALLTELGIAGARRKPRRSARRRYVVRDGIMHAVPMSPATFATSSLLSARGKVRALCEPFVRRRSDAAPEESLAALARRRFGEEVFDYVVDPVVSGVFAGDPEQLSSRFALRTLHELEQQHGSIMLGAVRAARERRRSARDASNGSHTSSRIVSFADGLGQLTAALATACGGDTTIRRETRVLGIRRRHHQWLVTSEHGGRVERRAFDAVVLAIPAHAYAEVQLDASVAHRLAMVGEIRSAHIATLALGFRSEDVAHSLDGFGVLAPSREHSPVLGALFNSSLFVNRAPPNHVLVTCFLGGMRAPESALQSADDAVRAAMNALRPLIGVRAEPVITHHTRRLNAIPQLELGYGAIAHAASAVETDMPGLVLAGAWRTGASIGQCIAGGLEAGKRASAVATLSSAASGP